MAFEVSSNLKDHIVPLSLVKRYALAALAPFGRLAGLFLGSTFSFCYIGGELT